MHDRAALIAAVRRRRASGQLEYDQQFAEVLSILGHVEAVLLEALEYDWDQFEPAPEGPEAYLVDEGEDGSYDGVGAACDLEALLEVVQQWTVNLECAVHPIVLGLQRNDGRDPARFDGQLEYASLGEPVAAEAEEACDAPTVILQETHP